MPSLGSAAAPRAVIVGGSLAGMCTALALAKEGWWTTILERSSSKPTGMGIGIDRELLSSVTGVDASTLPVIETSFPATGWELVRDLLVTGVRSHPSITVRRGCRVIDILTRDGAPGAVVRTTDGDVRTDLVVGADGYGSTVRRFVAPERPHASYSGFVLWRGVVDEWRLDGGFAQGDVDFSLHEASSGLLATFGIPGADGDTRPGSRRGVFTWFDSTRTGLLRRSGMLDGDLVTGSVSGADIALDVLEDLRDGAGRWPEPWRRLVDQSLLTRDFIGTPIAEYLPSRLVRGAVALVGDAAHVVSPVSGAGFQTGLLDIAALATEVREAQGGDIPQSLRRYEQRRLKPARRLVAESRDWSRAFVSAR